VTFHETGFADVTITDRIGGVGDPNDLNPAANAIRALVPSSFTDYTGLVVVTSNNPGDGTNGNLILNPNITVLPLGASPLILTATQTGFSLPGVAGSTLGFTSSLAVNGLRTGDTVGLTGSIDATSTPPQSLSSPGTDIKSLSYVRGATYNLTAQSSITLLFAGDTAIYSATETAAPAVSTVPEPASVTLALIGAGLAGLAGWRQRKS
jgi:hypothetical protein